MKIVAEMVVKEIFMKYLFHKTKKISAKQLQQSEWLRARVWVSESVEEVLKIISLPILLPTLSELTFSLSSSQFLRQRPVSRILYFELLLFSLTLWLARSTKQKALQISRFILWIAAGVHYMLLFYTLTHFLRCFLLPVVCSGFVSFFSSNKKKISSSLALMFLSVVLFYCCPYNNRKTTVLEC